MGQALTAWRVLRENSRLRSGFACTQELYARAVHYTVYNHPHSSKHNLHNHTGDWRKTVPVYVNAHVHPSMRNDSWL